MDERLSELGIAALEARRHHLKLAERRNDLDTEIEQAYEAWQAALKVFYAYVTEAYPNGR